MGYCFMILVLLGSVTQVSSVSVSASASSQAVCGGDNAIIQGETLTLTCSYELASGETILQLEWYEYSSGSEGDRVFISNGVDNGAFALDLSGRAAYTFSVSGETNTISITSFDSLTDTTTYLCRVVLASSVQRDAEAVSLVTVYDPSLFTVSSYSINIGYRLGDEEADVVITTTISTDVFPVPEPTVDGTTVTCDSTTVTASACTCTFDALCGGQDVNASASFLNHDYTATIYPTDACEENDDSNEKDSGCEVGCIIGVSSACLVILVGGGGAGGYAIYVIVFKKKVSVYCTGFPPPTTEEVIRKAFPNAATAKLLTKSIGHAFISFKPESAEPDKIVEKAREVTISKEKLLIIKAVVLVHCTELPPSTTENDIRNTFPDAVTVKLQTEPKRLACMTFKSETEVDEIVKKGNEYDLTVREKKVHLKKLVVSILYCTDIHPSATEKEIREAFPDADSVEMQISHCHAYITFQTEAEVDTIIKDRDITICGKTLDMKKISYEESNEDVKVQVEPEFRPLVNRKPNQVAHSDNEEARSGSVTSASHVTTNEKGTGVVTAMGPGQHHSGSK